MVLRRVHHRTGRAGDGRSARPNVGYALLGQVIEAASGTSYGEFVKREVVVPLGLQNTGPGLFALDPTAADPAAVPIKLDVTGPTAARLGHASGYGSSGETLEFDLGDDGRGRSIRGSSGMSWHPFEAFAAAVAARDRVQVGSPIQPPHPRPPPRHPLPSGPAEGPAVGP